jgi:beta-lactamase class A
VRRVAAIVAGLAAIGAPSALAHEPPSAPRYVRAAARAPLPHRAHAAAKAHKYPWAKRVASARTYLHSRIGHVAFAVVDEKGTLRGQRGNVQYRSASLVKAMFLVAYLNRLPHRALTRGDRALLHPMITRSDNNAATRVRNITGPGRVYGVAKRAGMTRFVLKQRWGDTLVTANDQARFFAKIDRLVVERHRHYARSLLASIIPEQRWGIPPAVPAQWRVFFKAGWRPLGGRQIVNQAALIERGKRRASLAVMTVDEPSQGYGEATIRGVARHVFRGLR